MAVYLRPEIISLRSDTVTQEVTGADAAGAGAMPRAPSARRYIGFQQFLIAQGLTNGG
jgi:hypothetical protein